MWITRCLIYVTNSIFYVDKPSNDDSILPSLPLYHLLCGHACLALLKSKMDSSFPVHTPSCKLYKPDEFDESEENLRQVAHAELENSLQGFIRAMGEKHWMIPLVRQCEKYCLLEDPLACKVVRYYFEPHQAKKESNG